MKKMIVLGFAFCLIALFKVTIVFAEPYKGKAFPEQQVIKKYCEAVRGSSCTYLGKFKEKEGRYDIHFAVDGSTYPPSSVTQLDTGIWIIDISNLGRFIIMQ